MILTIIIIIIILIGQKEQPLFYSPYRVFGGSDGFIWPSLLYRSGGKYSLGFNLSSPIAQFCEITWRECTWRCPGDEACQNRTILASFPPTSESYYGYKVAWTVEWTVRSKGWCFFFFWDKKEAKFSRLVGLVSAKQELLKLKYFIKTKESEEYR